MRAFIAVFGARMRTLLRYQTAALAGVGTQFVFGAILLAGRQAYAALPGAPEPLDPAQLATYTWLCQAFFALSPYTTDPDPEIGRMIRDGTVAYELARPVDLHGLWFARQAANRLAPALLRCGPILLVAGLWLGLRPPANVPTACAFLISLACTVGLVAAWTTWISTTLLWTVSGEGVARIAPVLVMAGSGQLVPLAVFPEPLRTVASWLPFAGMVDIPFSIWTGALAPDRWAPMIGRQVGWTLLLVLLGRWMLSHGLRRLTVQGG